MQTYHKDKILTTEDRQKLLTIARQFVTACANNAKFPAYVDTTTTLRNLKHGVFVSIYTGKQLRGCKGVVESALPLYYEVARIASQSATDSRFKGSLDHLDLSKAKITIEVISNLEKINNPLNFTIGVHGIAIRFNQRLGVFLPDSIIEQQWTKEKALSECCARKLLIASDKWSDKEASVYKFTTIKFSDS